MTHGGQHEKTFEKTAKIVAEKMGKLGCWSVKTRRNVGVKVGCYLTAESEDPTFGGASRPTHYVQCEHGKKKVAGSSRKKALKLAKVSQTWCSKCGKAHAKLLEEKQVDEKTN